MGARRASPRRFRERRLRQLRAALLASLPLVSGALFFGLPPAADPHAGIPAYAKGSARVAEAYHFASSDEAWILQWMACYCGCGGHSGHASNLACFVKGDGSGFDEHGANCGVCVDIALTAKAMHAQGTPLLQIRQTIDARHPGYPATSTPLPP